MRQWQPNGSHQDYWRSDNPLLGGWWRFGDDLPKNNFLANDEAGSPTAYLSGLMTDSGPQKHHLLPWVRTNSNVESILTPVPGIAPWALDGSGCRVNWNNAVDTMDFLYADPAYVIQNEVSIDHGTFSHGPTMYSGMTVIGWAQIPATNGTFTGPSTLVGRADQDTSIPHIKWRALWTEPSAGTYTFQATFLTAATMIFNGTGTSPVTQVVQGTSIASSDFPFFPTDRTKPFFFGVQYRREEVEGNRSFTGNGSGIVKLFVGTEASGITASVERFIRGSNIGAIHRTPDIAGTPLSFFNESRGLRASVYTGPNRFSPDGTILDEVVFVNDGFMSPERIEHYALSGITKIDTSDPEHPDFEPEFPGDDGLVAYWGFDEDDGHNTAPPTLNDPRLEFSLSGLGTTISFAGGIRDGRCIQIESNNAAADPTDGEIMLARNDYPAIPAESGLALLFPSGHVIDEGMTFIGWKRSTKPSATVIQGAGWGWYGADGARQSFADEAMNLSLTVGRNVLSVSTDPSGATLLAGNPRVNSMVTTSLTNHPGAGLGLTATAAVVDSKYDVGEDDWHLWAMVMDLKAGMIYLVKDAKWVIPMTQQISSASGWSSNGFGPFEGFFGLVPRGTILTQFDDIAVYNRILSIPEMSGFALNGIGGAPLQPDITTTQKALVGYWPFDQFTNYDPDGISGSRINDESWYFHHLTNVSGAFSQAPRLHSEVSDFNNSMQVDLSGSMISLERVFHGANLDASSSNLFSTSGFAAGTWAYLPSGDLQTQGNGSSGLFGTHMFMGAWGEASDDRSWFMGIEDNRLALKFFQDGVGLFEFDSQVEPIYNEPFFIGCNFFPSGSALQAQMVYVRESILSTTEYAIDSSFGLGGTASQPVGESGISFFNAPGQQWGFPSGTRIQHAFMYRGYLEDDQWQRVKRAGIDVIPLASGGVSVTDPSNISHWRFDRGGASAFDRGREQNHLFPINTDGHDIGVRRSIHESGAIVRQPEYLDTLPSNPGSRRLDLGSGNQSWTALGWITPPEVAGNDQHVILNKGSGPSASPTGIQIFTPPDSLQAASIAGDSTATGENGDLFPNEWSHLAVTYDRDNNEFGVIINGRYAGTSFISLSEIPVNNSGLSLGGRGDINFDALAGGSAFSGVLDDVMLFGRVLTLPEISGLAANSYNFNSEAQSLSQSIGAWISGIPENVISGLLGSYIYGQGQDIGLVGGHLTGVSGEVSVYGGYIQGKATLSGLTGGFTHGILQQSGVFGHYIHGLDVVSGLFGHYMFGASQQQDEFDVTLTFEIETLQDFDARLGVEKTRIYNFDSRLGVTRITRPPQCTFALPEVGTIASGVPYTLTVQGSGIALDDKKIGKVRFTFADFKGAAEGTLVDGVAFSGLYEASREFDTPGWYTVKMEVVDSYGYRTSCVRPFLLVPSGSESGTYVSTLPGVSISGTPMAGSAIHRAFFTHSIFGLDTTSGVLEYTDFADQQETLVNSLEVPSGTQFVDFVRTHDYTMPGKYATVWAVSGSWGIVSDSLSDGIDFA